MKVVYVLSTGPLYGDNIALRTILPTLTKLGVEPLIVVPNNSDSHREFERLRYPCIGYEKNYSNCATTSNPYKAVYRFLRREWRRYRSGEMEYWEILQKVKVFKPELVHTNCSFVDLGLHLSVSLHIPHVMHIREYGLKDARVRHFPCDKWFGIIQRYLGYNITITDAIRQYFSLPKRNTRAIYDGVFPVEKPYALVEEKEDYVLYVGRLVEQKGVRDAVRAFCEIAKENTSIQMKIAGEGDDYYRDELCEIVAANNLQDRVHFLGYRTDVWELMSKAKVLLVPSSFEAFGFISAEAIYNGCPVIGRSTAGTQEQCDNVSELNRENLMFITFDTEDELVVALRKSLAKKYKKEELQRYHNKVADLYCSEQSGTNVFEFYKKILRK